MKIPFNVNASTARLIGRENVAKLDGAILELVKNTYDSDAKICLIYYNDINNSLIIADNGTGMSGDTIINNWMTIGNSTKVENFYSKNGRIQTGAKGIGRFALDRISSCCKMYTTNENNSISWTINWDLFENSKNITDVTAEIEYLDKKSLYKMIPKINNYELTDFISKNFSTGTLFELSNLRDDWNKATFENIKQSLTSLIPANIENEFKIYLVDNHSNIDNCIILPNIIDSYDYKINFKSHNNIVNVSIYRNEFNFGKNLDKIIAETPFTDDDKNYFMGEPICKSVSIEELVPGIDKKTIDSVGDFYGEFYFYKNSSTKKDREKYFYKEIVERKKYSDIFGGIKIYRDNFRIRPYGEAKSSNFDWLLLSNRKTNSPAALSHPTGAWRVAADQIYGNVNISRMNVNLPDQSNREGILETKAFKILKETLISIIQLFEKDRQYVGRILSDYYKSKHPAEIYQAEIEEEKNDNHLERGQSKFIEKSKAKIVIQEKEEIIQNLENENKLLLALATSGIITNSYVHETKTALHNIGMSLRTAEEALEYDNDLKTAITNIREAIDYKETMNCWYKVTIDSITRDKRKMKKVNLNDLINNLITTWNENLKLQNIKINFSGANIELRCYPYEIESIISNLITNSVSAFYPNVLKQIDIKLSILNNGVKISYVDSGKGLSDCYKSNPEKILDAFESDKRDENGELVGTGMGMWIVNKIVKDYNGNINLSKNTTKTNGFEIEIELFSH